MEKISIFNYEAYYLDYLEGNLNDEDTALLLTFLEEHPELKVEDDLLPTLNGESASLETQFKADLKQIDFNNAAITSETAEQFIIAETEGLLSNKKEDELAAFIGTNESLRKTQRLYAASKLKPDLSVVFTDKDSLKKDRKIIFWPYIALAAAASVAAFFFFMQPAPTGKSLNNNGEITAGKDVIKKKKHGQTIQEEYRGSFPVTSEQIAKGEVKNEHRADSKKNVDEKVILPDLTDESVNQLAFNNVREVNNPRNTPDLIEENHSRSGNNGDLQRKPEDYTMLGFQDMNNPIKPVTNRLGNVINQQVDFRTAKKNSKRAGGFYFRIGNFVISHKKH